jgi:hypothetical protein
LQEAAGGIDERAGGGRDSGGVGAMPHRERQPVLGDELCRDAFVVD